MAVPLFALRNIELKAIRAGKLPCWAGHRKSHFLVGRPNITVNPRSLGIEGTDRVRRSVLRAGVVRPPLSTVLSPGRKGDRPSRKFEQIAVEMKIAQRQLKGAGAMQGYIDSANGRRAVAAEESQERIKRRRRIGIE